MRVEKRESDVDVEAAQYYVSVMVACCYFMSAVTIELFSIVFPA